MDLYGGLKAVDVCLTLRIAPGATTVLFERAANLGHEISGSNGGNVSAPSRHTAGAGAQAYEDLGRISVELLTLQWRPAPTSLRCTSSPCEDW
jgi:hypothetical protein